MHPDLTINSYESVQGLVEERIARAKHRMKVHQLMQDARARKQFRRSVTQGLRRGLTGRDLSSELCFTLHGQACN
ncbi:hypothetical protein ACFLTM_02020 [Candidatus Bipolaricaulota bacterium]